MKLTRVLFAAILFTGCASSNDGDKPKDTGPDSCCEDTSVDVEADQEVDLEVDQAPPRDMVIFADQKPDQAPPDQAPLDQTPPDQTPLDQTPPPDQMPLDQTHPDQTHPDQSIDGPLDSSVDTMADAATDADAVVTDSMSDADAPQWTCSEIYTCARQCTSLSDLSCLIPCRENGCASGQSTALALNFCALDSCSTECATNSTPCDNCIQANCLTEYNDCMANSCRAD